MWLIGVMCEIICSIGIDLDTTIEFDLGDPKRRVCRSCDRHILLSKS
jgi:hypothetical protein